MIIIQQIFLGFLFLIISFFCFTLPAFYLFKRIKIDLDDNLDKFVLYSVLGFVLFTLTAYILAALHLRFLMYLFPLLGAWTFYKYREYILNTKFKIENKLFFYLVFTIGIIGMVAVNAPSGFPYKDGIYFYSSHGHDGVWHVSLMEGMHKDVFPFQNPELAGEKIQNYHFFADLLMS